MSSIKEMDFKSAHKFSSWHRDELLRSDSCGCFHCMKIFTSDKIHEWVDDDDNDIGQTAMCPYCDIDSVVGSASGVSITKEFLSGMNQLWFNC